MYYNGFHYGLLHLTCVSHFQGFADSTVLSQLLNFKSEVTTKLNDLRTQVENIELSNLYFIYLQ